MRKSTNIVVFYLYFTGAATLLEVAGITAAMGTSVKGSVPQKLQEAEATFEAFDTSGGFGETLFGLYNSVANVAEVMFAAVTAGPRLITNAGVPVEIVTFLFLPAGIIVGADIIYVLAGRDL